VKHDTETGNHQRWDYGEGCYGNEAPFAPRKGATAEDAEDDGYVVTFVTDTETWKTECHVFDARNVGDGPIARVKIPQRVPSGFHCAWVKGEDLGWA
jgi:carotenoid cleavage dioxygenase-like enzyme